MMVRLADKTISETSWNNFTTHCYKEMTRLGSIAWSAYPAANLWGASFKLYEPATHGGLRLLYGICFGLRVTESSSFTTITGNIMDDVERSLRPRT